MVLCNRFTLNIVKSTSLRGLTTQPAPLVRSPEPALTQTFRTLENDPRNHGAQHYNKFYTVPTNHLTTLIGSMPTPFPELKMQVKTFAECSILIRKPALEIIKYLVRTDYSKPVNKYVLYGESGTGKTMSLLHVLHYALLTDQIIIYLPWVPQWYTSPTDFSTSISKDLIDLPLDAAVFLTSFKRINFTLLSKLNLTLSKSYSFGDGVGESFEQGQKLENIVNYGIDRVKYACDVIAVLFSELKEASIANKCKVFVALDGFNAFYSELTKIKDQNRQFVPAAKISLTQMFLDLTKSNWCNGQIVVTVDVDAVKETQDSCLPRYLLTKDGFNHLDPFLPVAVNNYTKDEFDTILEYYKNRKWIRSITPEGEKELVLLSGRNPFKLADCCKRL